MLYQLNYPVTRVRHGDTGEWSAPERVVIYSPRDMRSTTKGSHPGARMALRPRTAGQDAAPGLPPRRFLRKPPGAARTSPDCSLPNSLPLWPIRPPEFPAETAASVFLRITSGQNRCTASLNRCPAFLPKHHTHKRLEWLIDRTDCCTYNEKVFSTVSPVMLPRLRCNKLAQLFSLAAVALWLGVSSWHFALHPEHALTAAVAFAHHSSAGDSLHSDASHGHGTADAPCLACVVASSPVLGASAPHAVDSATALLLLPCDAGRIPTRAAMGVTHLRGPPA